LENNHQLYLLFHVIKMSIYPFTDSYINKLWIFDIFRVDRIGNQLDEEIEILTKILLELTEKLISLHEQDKLQ